MADGLSSGFLTRQREMKSENSGENLSGSLTVGGGFVGIMNMAWWGRRREREGQVDIVKATSEAGSPSWGVHQHMEASLQPSPEQ